MLACICGRFRVELAAQMGGEAGVLERQISSFTLAVDGGLFLHFHDRAQARAAACPATLSPEQAQRLVPLWQQRQQIRAGDRSSMPAHH